MEKISTPFDVVEKRLDTFSPLTHCCCLCCKCSLNCGLKWALGFLMVEAVGHVALSGARPRWEWNSNGWTIFAFAMQIVMRIILLPLIPFAWWAIPKGLSTLWVIRAFFRAMIVVCLLRLLEIILSFVEVRPPKTLLRHRLRHAFNLTCHSNRQTNAQVRAICIHPHIQQLRVTRGNLTAAQLDGANRRCEIISDVYNFVLGLIMLGVYCHITRVVQQHMRMAVPPPPRMSIVSDLDEPVSEMSLDRSYAHELQLSHAMATA
jgi:hypothetical protein